MTVSAICFIGVEMLTVSEDFVIHIGDILCILSAFMFSLVILLEIGIQKQMIQLN